MCDPLNGRSNFTDHLNILTPFRKKYKAFILKTKLTTRRDHEAAAITAIVSIRPPIHVADEDEDELSTAGPLHNTITIDPAVEIATPHILVWPWMLL